MFYDLARPACLLFLGLGVLLQASCGRGVPALHDESQNRLVSVASGRTVSFESVFAGALLGGGIRKPTLVVIHDLPGLQQAKAKFRSINWERIDKTDFGQHLVLLIFWGSMPAGGYAVEVSSIVQENRSLRVSAGLKESGTKVDAATVPFQAVRMRKQDVHGTGEVEFVLVDSAGSELTRSRVAIHG